MTELVLEHKDGKTVLAKSTLVVVLDDTGNEEFLDPKYPVFGIGGCAFLVGDYQRLIEYPWNYLCEKYFPDTKRPLHAADLNSPSQEQLEALNSFFEKFEFFRLAVTASIKSQKEVDNNFIEIVGSSILKRICDVGKWARFDRLVIIFEESDRIELQVLRSLSGKKLKSDDHLIEIELALMPKSACMPALEVADFIIHTAGAQTRSRNAGNANVRKDFEKIFRHKKKELISFMEITRVVGNKVQD